MDANLRINGERLWASLMDMAKVGPGVRGGNNRQTLSDADRQGRDLFAAWCRDAGLSVGVDKVGNMFAERAGSDGEAAPVVVGSHLDTQPTGGKYDGVLGVLAGLELVRTLDDLAIATRRPIVVANWTNEEGTRFSPAMLGSGVFAGVHSLEYAYGRTDTTGHRFGDELRRIGYVGEEAIASRTIHAYLELHIEQGPILEEEGIDIGVVSRAQGLRWLAMQLTGKESHTGTTPMGRRADAGLGAARIVAAVNDIALANGPDAVATVGYMAIEPNSTNIIPGRASLTADIRNPDLATLEAMRARLVDEAAAIARAGGLELNVEEAGSYDPVAFDERCIDAVRRAAQRLGYSHREMISGAGHDACHIARIAPTAMIFCPCVDGLSHNEDEDIKPAWAEAGANILCHAALDLAEIAA